MARMVAPGTGIDRALKRVITGRVADGRLPNPPADTSQPYLEVSCRYLQISDTFIYMKLTKKYLSDDLVAVVWPNQSESQVRAGEKTWEEVARGAWAMDAEKADRVRVLVAVFDDIVVRAWAVTNATHHTEIPEGKTRRVSRSTFEITAEARLDYLVGGPSPRARQRNPQATFELRDLQAPSRSPGAQRRPPPGWSG